MGWTASFALSCISHALEGDAAPALRVYPSSADCRRCPRVHFRSSSSSGREPRRRRTFPDNRRAYAEDRRTVSGFRKRAGRWPTNTFEILAAFLTTDKSAVQDGGGHHLVLTLGYQQRGPTISSAGRDGKAGGTGEDGDFVMNLEWRPNSKFPWSLWRR